MIGDSFWVWWGVGDGSFNEAMSLGEQRQSLLNKE
jgi:hypothetical protein